MAAYHPCTVPGALLSVPPHPDQPGGVAVDVRVPAKVNLFLAVRGLRSDGYHELVSIMQTVSVRDRVRVSMDADAAYLHPAARRLLRVEFSHDGTDGVPTGEDNLVVRAADALLHRLGGNGASRVEGDHALITRVHLDKQIPVAAGMAGGSADAAATLVALNALWDGGLGRDELRELAAELGADVPFCVTGGTALATGTGTATAQVLCRGTFHWVVGMSEAPLSTPEVYRTFDDIGTPTQKEPDVVLQALRTGDAEVLGDALHNDLEVAAFAPAPRARGRPRRDARGRGARRGRVGVRTDGHRAGRGPHRRGTDPGRGGRPLRPDRGRHLAERRADPLVLTAGTGSST